MNPPFRFLKFLFVAAFTFALLHGLRAEINFPEIKDPRFELSIFAAEPQIVNPIGLAIDRRGRLFVIESHTHQRKPDYTGPKQDQIKIFEDTDHDGKADKVSVFAEVPFHAMNLAFSPDGKLYLTHRNGVAILNDKDGDGVSESMTTVLDLKTEAIYPHNAISGIAFSADGWLYVGEGENHGSNYVLHASDGGTHAGGGEGGKIFRCKPDGSKMEVFARGFWNPFGLLFDRAGRLFCVDNDPHSRPPCRFLHIVPQGDYGYIYKYSAHGLHPYIAWNGELPGTLPMISGTGEAPCSILDAATVQMPHEYDGAFFITSWGDHYLEYYFPKPFGASFRADRHILIQGDENFRPVTLAPAPDGSIYFTDWIRRDYSVTQLGRIWHLWVKPGVKTNRAIDSEKKLPLTAAEKRMQKLLAANSLKSFSELISALLDKDPFIFGTAITSLARPVFREKILGEVENRNPKIRLGALLALRRGGFTNANSLLSKALKDPDDQVRLVALKWIGEDEIKSLAERIAVALSAGPVSQDLFRTYAATAQILSGTEKSSAATLVPANAPASVRTMVLAMSAMQDDRTALEILGKSAREVETGLRIEAVRTLAQSTNAAAFVLKKVASDKKNPTDLRAEAILAFAARTADELILLLPLLDDKDSAVRIETVRTLRSFAGNKTIRAALEKKFQLVKGNAAEKPLFEQLAFALGDEACKKNRPQTPADWRDAVAKEPGDIASGRRVFFNPSVGCAKCHRIESRGGQIGPDLSAISRTAKTEQFLQSILTPSQEIAPQFVAHNIETHDGESYTGLLAGEGPDGSVSLVLSDGKGILIPAKKISLNQMSKVSLMPEGLANGMTVQDFRDLIAFLLSRI